MKNFVILCDSSHDLTDDFVAKNKVHVVPYSLSMDGKTYKKDRLEISMEEMYAFLKNKNVFPKTSQPTMTDYEAAFRPILEAGQDILCIINTHKMSGSIQSAHLAKDLIQNEFPERRIEILDSHAVTLGQGSIVYEALRMKEAGFTIEETIRRLEIIRDQLEIYVTVDTLVYLQKGGRIGTAGALAGSLLSIKPIIVLRDGELTAETKVRGRKKAIQEIMFLLAGKIADKKEKYHVYLNHADALEEALFIEKTLFDTYGITFLFPPLPLGATVVSHIGPTTLALGYTLKYEYADDIE